jgi:MIP family channel proteins
MSSLLRRSTAEALGTFGLIFIGTAVIVVKGYPDAQSGLLGVALAHAMVLSIMITATMSISGGHLNPAVTVGLLVARRVSVRTAAAYIVAQLAGAVLGALMLKAIFPLNILRSEAFGTPSIVGTMTLGQAMVVEGVLTFFLVSAVFGTCVNADAPKVGGFGVGLVLLFDILVGGPLTGSAVNPARAFGPALVSGQWIGHIVYWVGPLAGGIVAAVLWEYWLLRKTAKG